MKQQITIKCIPFTILLVLVVMTLTSSCNKKEGNEKDLSIKEIHWIENIDEAFALAQEHNKPLMIDFTATWCPPCRMMEDSTFTNPYVIKIADAFITVRIDVDKQGDVANQFQSNAGKYGGIGIPNILFLDKNKNELKHPIGFKNPEALIAIMDSVLTMIE